MTGLLWNILGLLAMVLLTIGTALFVAAEFSLTALDRSQVENHVRRVGDRKAHRVRQAHQSLSFQLSGAQVGITITTITTGYVAEPAIADLVNPVLQAIGLPTGAAFPIALIVALLLVNFFSMLFGELVPKNLAIARPLPTARAVAGIQTRFSAALRWFIKGLNNSANWLLRRFGIQPADQLASARSPQELGSLVRASAAGGC